MPQPLPPTPATPGGRPPTPPNTWQGLLVTGTAGAGGPPAITAGTLFKGASPASPVPLAYVATPAAPAPKANAAATFSFTGADAAVFMSLQKLNFTFRTDWAAGGRGGPATVWVATNLTSSAVLGCPDGGCGPNGRCAPPPPDAADPRGRKGPQPACVCRCGFTGPTCDQVDPAPPAKCPPYPSWPATFVAPTPPASLLASGGGGGVLGSLAGVTAGGEPCTCAAGGGGLAALLASSTCDPGWAGVYCNACTSDDACAAATGDPGATCSNALEYQARTVTKSYVCDLADTVVGALVDPRRGYWFNCTTTPVEWPGLLDKKGRPRVGGSCELGIGLSTDPENPIVCTAQACVFVPGSAGVRCPSTSCACPAGPPGPDGVPACPAIAASYVSLIDGKPVDASCTPDGACTLDVKDFPIKLTAKCTAGDCQSEEAALLKGGVLEQPRDYSSVIAAIPIMALVCLAGVAGVQMLAATGRLAGGAGGGAGGAAAAKGGGSTADSTARGVGGAGPAAAALGGTGALAAAAKAGASAAAAGLRPPAHPIRELRWWDLSCTVPATRFAPNHGAGAGGGGGGGAAGPALAGGLGALVSSVADAVSPTARRTGLPPSVGALHERGGNPLAHCTSSAAMLAEAAARRPGAPSPGATPTTASAAAAAAAASAPAAPAPAARAGGWFAPARPRVHILRAAAGEARMGELVGVLGPSGCGKTTMLSILAGSVSSLSASSRVTGHITLDGEKRRGWASRLVAYVPQFDFLLPTLTVAETLRYSALLRLPASTPPADIAARVAATIEELGLTHVSGAQVGGSSGIRGVSGGERRRVTIGMELVIDPAIIVLDEPTSGLDSHTALNLMVTLKAVAAAGRIVMLSFHQPSPAMFDLLDRSFLMARGNVLYSGPPGGVPAFFEAAGCPVPPGTAAAEHMLTAVSDPKLRDPLLAHAAARRAAEREAAARGVGADGGPATASTPRGSSGDDGYTSDGSEDGGRPAGPSPRTGPLLTIESGRSADLEAGAAAARVCALRGGGGASNPCALTTRRLRKPARTPFGRELAVLFWRTLTEIWRNPSLLAMHCVMAIVMGLLCGGIFYNLKFDIAGAQGRLGAVFFALTLMALTSLTTVDLLTNERGLVVKVREKGERREAEMGRGEGGSGARARLLFVSLPPKHPHHPPSPPPLPSLSPPLPPHSRNASPATTAPSPTTCPRPPWTACCCASSPPCCSPSPSTPCPASSTARPRSPSSSASWPSSPPPWAPCPWPSPSASARPGGPPWS